MVVSRENCEGGLRGRKKGEQRHTGWVGWWEGKWLATGAIVERQFPNTKNNLQPGRCREESRCTAQRTTTANDLTCEMSGLVRRAKAQERRRGECRTDNE